MKPKKENYHPMYLTDTDKLWSQIDNMFNEFMDINNKEPEYAICEIMWIDTHCYEEVKISLSSDSYSDDNDEYLFYCDSTDDLKALCKQGCESFVITNIISYK